MPKKHNTDSSGPSPVLSALLLDSLFYKWSEKCDSISSIDFFIAQYFLNLLLWKICIYNKYLNESIQYEFL